MLKKLVRSTFTLLGLLPVTLFCESLRAESSAEVVRNTRAVATLQLGAPLGGDLDLLLPLYGNTTHLWYADVQAYRYGNQYQTLGFGSGYRQIIDDAIYGIYTFVDRQTSSHKVYHTRYNIGLERLGQTWDFRANAYWYPHAAATTLVDRGISAAAIQGNDIVYTHLYEVEKVYNGGDVEIGRTLGMDTLRGYLGYYHFGEAIKGPKARIEYQFNQRLGLSASTQHDSRGWLSYAGISYWFGKTRMASATGIEARMLAPIVRDKTVADKVIDQSASYDVDPNKVYFVSAEGVANNPGTQAAPMTAQQALATAKPNDVIYVLGDQPIDLGGNFTLKDGQQLLGNASDLSYKGFTLLKGDPNLRTHFTQGTLIIDSAVHLEGFDFTAMGNTPYGIVIQGDHAVSLRDVTVSGYAEAGIQVSGNAKVQLTDVSVNQNGQGLSIENGQVEIAGTQNSFSDSTKGSGIAVSGAGTLSLLRNATISNNLGGDGLLLGGDAASTTLLENVVSTGNAGHGIWVNNPNAIVNIQNIRSNDNIAGSGLWIEEGIVSDLSSTQNEFKNNGAYGILVGSDPGVGERTSGSLLTLSNANTSYNQKDGILLHNNKTDTVNLRDIISEGSRGIALAQAGVVNLETVDTSFNEKSSGLRIDHPDLIVNGQTISSDHNGYYGLNVIHGQVNIAGGTNQFSHNALEGIAVNNSDSTLDLAQATIEGNLRSGIYLGANAAPGRVSVADSIISSNTEFGIILIGAQEVSLSNITIQNSGISNILVMSNSHLRLEGHVSITGALDRAIEVYEASSVTITDPHLTLTGIIGNFSETTGDSSTIAINGQAVITSQGEQKTCSITEGSGSCE